MEQQPEVQGNQKEKQSALVKEVISWVKVIVAAVVFAFIINGFIIVNASVPSGSMMDTIPEKSRIVAFRLAYKLEDPERFDVVVFRYPDNETIFYVKRIIGLPGDKVEIKEGKVYINDNETPLRDDFVKGIPTHNYGPYYVPEKCYFMLGDNRENSEDSRYWHNTFVQEKKILGKVFVCYWPFDKAKLIK